MARLKDGHRDAAPAVFAALWPVLVRFAERALSDVAAAEEAAQRALVRLFGQIARYDVDRDGLSWAYAVTAWEIRTVRREQARRKQDAWSEGLDRAATSSDPEAEALHREVAVLLSEAMRQLPDIDQTTIDALLTETGPRTALTAALRKRRQRALERLRSIWRDLYGAS